MLNGNKLNILFALTLTLNTHKMGLIQDKDIDLDVFSKLYRGQMGSESKALIHVFLKWRGLCHKYRITVGLAWLYHWYSA